MNYDPLKKPMLMHKKDRDLSMQESRCLIPFKNEVSLN